MRGTVAKMLRRAAETRSTATAYEPLAIHHLATHPEYERYTRTVREMGPVVKGAVSNEKLCNYGVLSQWMPRSGARAYVVSRDVVKIRFKPDGKTPMKPLVSWSVDEDGGLVIEPQSTLVPVAKPIRCKAGSPRRVLKVLKRLYRAGKLDEVFKQIQAEAA